MRPSGRGKVPALEQNPEGVHRFPSVFSSVPSLYRSTLTISASLPNPGFVTHPLPLRQPYETLWPWSSLGTFVCFKICKEGREWSHLSMAPEDKRKEIQPKFNRESCEVNRKCPEDIGHDPARVFTQENWDRMKACQERMRQVPRSRVKHGCKKMERFTDLRVILSQGPC